MVQDKICFQKPTKFNGFRKTITHVLAVDENGCAGNLDYVKKQIALGKKVDLSRNFFTLTGCLYTRDEYESNRFLLTELKKQYWHDRYGEVLLHSREIRKREGFFFLPPAKSKKFQESLTNTMSMIACKVFSITFDMQKYVTKQYTHDPYTVAFDFLLSQIMHHTKRGDKVCIILESRGKNDDHLLLQYIKKVILQTGMKSSSKEKIQGRVRGIFFNDKCPRDSKDNAYSGIEIVDLFSYPIFQYMAYNKTSRPFSTIEPKFADYPDYMKKSIRLFADGQKKIRRKK